MLTADITNSENVEVIKVLLEIAKINGFKSAKISPQCSLTNEKLDIIFNYSKTIDISVYAVCNSIEMIDTMAHYTDTCEIQDINLLREARNKFKNLIVNVNNLNMEEIENIYFTYGPQWFVVETDRISIIKKIRHIGSIKICYKNNMNEILHHLALAFGVNGLERVINLKESDTVSGYVRRINYTKSAVL